MPGMTTFGSTPECDDCGEEVDPTDSNVDVIPRPVDVTTFGAEARHFDVGVPLYRHRICPPRN